MSEHAGHTISVSGITLIICWVGLIFFPMDLLSSMGLAAAIAVFCTLLVNLTLTPVLLLIFGNFFKNFSLGKRIRKNKNQKEEENKTKEELKAIELAKQLRSFWYKIGKFSTKYAIIVILMVLIVAIPVSIQVLQLERTVDTNQVFPRGADTVEVYNILSDDFNAGRISPFYIMITTGVTNGVLTQECFSDAQQLLDNLNETLGLPYNSFSTFFMLPNGLPIPFIYAEQYMNPESLLFNTNEGTLFRIAFDRYTNNLNSTVIIQIETPFDPFGTFGVYGI